jgi:hypothetical protein
MSKFEYDPATTPEEFKSSIPEGYQVFKVRQPKRRVKSVPRWAQGEASLVRHAAGEYAMRRIEIARRYWLLNETSGQIAKSLGVNRAVVENVIHSLLHRKPNASCTY